MDDISLLEEPSLPAAMRGQTPPDRPGQKSGFRRRARNAFAYPRLTVGSLILVVLVGGSALAPVIATQAPDAIHPLARLQGPSGRFLLGTDTLGRDQLSRILYGGQTTFIVVGAATLVAASVGVAMGLASGYGRGWIDAPVMRLMDGLLSFPSLILAMTIAFVLGPSLTTIVVALSVIQVPSFARVVRSQALALSKAEFVEAAQASGTRTVRILYRHLLVNMTDVLLVQLSIAAGQTILTEASLSFLGLGIPPPAPSWGGMLHDGYPYLQFAPWASIIPGAVIFLAVLAFNLVGDGLRDLLDTSRRRFV
jgi:peptide/nickel transport system permease protein